MKKRFSTPVAVGWFVAGSFFLCLSVPAVLSAEAKPVILGLSAPEADKFNVEFQQYDRMIPVYRENGIRAALLDSAVFYDRDCAEDELLKTLKQFHVIHLNMGEESLNRFDAAHKRRVAVVGRALVRYVEEGGGLFLQLRVANYPGDENELYWNALLANFGAASLHEGVFDKTRTIQGDTLPQQKVTFWHTRNIQPHAVTNGVSCLYLPLHGPCDCAGVAALRYSPEWTVLVRGEAEAHSYKCGDDTNINLNAEGTYQRTARAGGPPVGQRPDRLLSDLQPVHRAEPPQPALGRHRGAERRSGRRPA